MGIVIWATSWYQRKKKVLCAFSILKECLFAKNLNTKIVYVSMEYLKQWMLCHYFIIRFSTRTISILLFRSNMNAAQKIIISVCSNVFWKWIGLDFISENAFRSILTTLSFAVVNNLQIAFPIKPPEPKTIILLNLNSSRWFTKRKIVKTIIWSNIKDIKGVNY